MVSYTRGTRSPKLSKVTGRTELRSAYDNHHDPDVREMEKCDRSVASLTRTAGSWIKKYYGSYSNLEKVFTPLEPVHRSAEEAKERVRARDPLMCCQGRVQSLSHGNPSTGRAEALCQHYFCASAPPTISINSFVIAS